MNIDQENEQLAAITQMRDLMERSSKFLSLSGLAGILVGCLAIIGVVIAYYILGIPFKEYAYLNYLPIEEPIYLNEQFQLLFLDCMSVLFFAVIVGSLFAIKNARKKGLPIWDATSKRLMFNMLIPLLAGGLFIVALLNQHLVELILPVMLIFYGMALLNASKYAIDDIRYLGMIEIGLGLVASYKPAFGLCIWAIGFGILHIIYGTAIYFKYEK